MEQSTLTHKLLSLVADERFAAMEALSNSPNLFRIVGRTHTETWHSMFLSWLLDPKGSHGLGSFALRRFLLALTSPDLEPSHTVNLDNVAKTAALGNLDEASVTPNERESSERVISSGQRVDIFIEDLSCEGSPDCIVLIEQKVNAPISPSQCRAYADWMWATYPNQIKVPVMLAPDCRLGTTGLETMGDERWCAISYQTLHDVVLAPALRAPGLNVLTAPLLNQYVEGLRLTFRGRKLAVTDDEKDLALAIYDSHKDALHSIAAAIRGEVDLDISEQTAERVPLSLSVDGVALTGNSVSDFYQKILNLVALHPEKFDPHLPFSTGTKRYLIAREPFHPGGSPFRAKVEHDGRYMESHKSRIQALKDAARFLVNAGCKVSGSVSNAGGGSR